MKELQTFGLVITLFGWLILVYTFSNLDPNMSYSAGAATMLPVVTIFPIWILLSFLSIVPTSIALLWPKVRQHSQFKGAFWYGIWCINGMVSIFYVFVFFGLRLLFL